MNFGTSERVEKAGSASQSQRMHGAGYVGAIVGQVGRVRRVGGLRRLGGLGMKYFSGV